MPSTHAVSLLSDQRCKEVEKEANGWMEEKDVIEKTELHPEFGGSGMLSIAIY
jgi:hypothetical protein